MAPTVLRVGAFRLFFFAREESRPMYTSSRREARRGTRGSAVEVTNVSSRGFWLLVDEREVFVGFDRFPWFLDATIRALTRVERPRPSHLRWPDLDVDLDIESLENPERYPLVSRATVSVVSDRGAPRPRRTANRRR